MDVPDPWRVLAGMHHVLLLRLPIPERGRYYHEPRAIVIRDDLLICEERAVLWHELVHARRGDISCGGPEVTARQEASVHREAARRAMPWPVLRWGLRRSATWWDLVDTMKVDDDLVRARLHTAHPAEKTFIHQWRAAREYAA